LVTFCPVWHWTTTFLISASQVAKITGMTHQRLALLIPTQVPQDSPLLQAPMEK
jgi:hypothetical protein